MTAEILLILRLALTGCLYAFLVWALWLLWQDLRLQGKKNTPKQLLPISLTLETETGVETLRFSEPEIAIGRDPACECFLDDLTISGRHARLSFHHGQWWVEDLHSKNGTLLNDVPVLEQVVITSGDRLMCGQRMMTITIGEST